MVIDAATGCKMKTGVGKCRREGFVVVGEIKPVKCPVSEYVCVCVGGGVGYLKCYPEGQVPGGYKA